MKYKYRQNDIMFTFSKLRRFRAGVTKSLCESGR